MKNILCLSGGGVRGILTLEVLKKIEKREGKRLCEVYDLIIGTSTGSIIAGGLALGLSTDTLYHYFETLCSKVFVKKWHHNFTNPFGIFSPKYDSKNIISELTSKYNKDLRDLKTLYMSTAYSVKDSKVKIFKSWRDEDNESYKLYDTVLASIAAPTYFSEYKGFIDGGVYSNNPSLIAALECRKIWKDESMNITSIGTGYISNEFKTTNWGALEWIIKKGRRPIVDIFTDSNSDLVKYACKNLSPDNYSYNHYDVDLTPFINDAPMDSCKKEYLNLLISLGKSIDI